MKEAVKEIVKETAKDKEKESEVGKDKEADKENNDKNNEKATSALDPLPSGWLERTDPGSGKVYYINKALRMTVWNRPKASDPVFLYV